MISGAIDDDRRHLQQDRVREKAHLEPAALHEQQRGRYTGERRERERRKRNAERDTERMREQRAIGVERLRDAQRTRARGTAECG